MCKAKNDRLVSSQDISCRPKSTQRANLQLSVPQDQNLDNADQLQQYSYVEAS